MPCQVLGLAHKKWKLHMCECCLFEYSVAVSSDVLISPVLNLTFTSLHPIPNTHTQTHTHTCKLMLTCTDQSSCNRAHTQAFIGYSGPSEMSTAAIKREIKDIRLPAE